MELQILYLTIVIIIGITCIWYKLEDIVKLLKKKKKC